VNCTICRRPTDDRDPIRHQRCADRLRTDLADIPGLYALMGAVLAPGTAGGGAHVSGTRTAPLPVRLEPLSLRARGGIITILATWEADWRETREMTAAQRGIRDRDLGAIVLWLRAHLPWAIEHHPAIQEFADEMRDVVRQCRAAAGLPSVPGDPRQHSRAGLRNRAVHRWCPLGRGATPRGRGHSVEGHLDHDHRGAVAP
jgi:hypothetical protein